jgi:tetratricopeptide (TPR) repeat protein
MKSHLFRRFVRLLSVFVFIQVAAAQTGGEVQELPSSGSAISEGNSMPERIYISGNAMQENGIPADGAIIELDCRGSVTKEATVDSSGAFSFRLGEGMRFNQQDQDLSQSVTDPFGRNSVMVPFDIGTISTSKAKAPKKPDNWAKLTGCTLRAALRGYKSSAIELGATPLSMFNNIGTIMLFPIEAVRGATVSATSFLAPKSAKKAMEKAKVALRKEKPFDAETHLRSAIALYPKYGEAWFQLGKLYQSQRRIPEAQEAYTKAIESDKLYVNPYVWLGLISAAEQKWQAAADLTQQALDLDPTAFPEAQYVNALANFHLQNLVPAEKSARQAALMDAKHLFPKLHLILASILSGREDFVGAIEELRKYIKYGPRGKLAVQKYGVKPYLESEWDSADASRRKEIASSAKSEVQHMLADFLPEAGLADPAKAELPVRPESGRIAEEPSRTNDSVKHFRNPEENAAAFRTTNEKTGISKEEPLDYIRYSLQNLPEFEPSGDQSPLDGILAAVGNNVFKLFANLFDLSAVENVRLERVDRKGNADRSDTFQYLYLCLGAIDKQDPVFEEFRSDLKGQETFQLGLDEGYMLTSGFVSAPLIFHPIHQSGNSFRLLGYQRIRGRNAVVISYTQIPGQCRLKGHFRVGNNVQETYKQGIAWIDLENHQILHLASDLLQTFPEIGLEKLRTEIDFDEVRFDQEKGRFWLPLQVVVAVNWNGKILRNTHAYSDFKRFGVQTSQKLEKPKEAEKELRETADPLRPAGRVADPLRIPDSQPK